MNESIRVVLFDLDDTLYEERNFVRSGFIAVAQFLSQNFRLESQELLGAMMDLLDREGRGTIFDRVLERFGILDPVLVERLISIYRHHTPQICLFRDVVPVFKELKQLGVQLGIITDGYHVAQRNKVRALGLEEFMDLIIYTDELGRDYWKPDPRSFKKAVTFFQTSGREAVYVGNDPSKDFAGPLAVGMRTLHLRRWGEDKTQCCAAELHGRDLCSLKSFINGTV